MPAFVLPSFLFLTLMAAACPLAAIAQIPLIVEPSKTAGIIPYEATSRPGLVLILPTADSTFVGMYSATDGHEILPPRYWNVTGYEPTDTLRDAIIFLMDSARTRYQDAGFTVLPGYEVKCGAFTRGGLLLYEPVWYDNGPDYWSEGRQRFVYDNRMGFVNRFGAVVMPARYPFVSQYHGGRAWACLDCKFEIVDSTDAEHGTAWVGTRWTPLDKAGVEGPVQTLPRGAYPPPPSNDTWPPLTEDEKRLAQQLLNGPVGVHFKKISRLKTDEAVVRVYDRPSAHSPYYHVAFDDVDSDGFFSDAFQFLVSPDGKEMHALVLPGMAVEGMEKWWAKQRAEMRER